MEKRKQQRTIPAKKKRLTLNISILKQVKINVHLSMHNSEIYYIFCSPIYL